MLSQGKHKRDMKKNTAKETMGIQYNVIQKKLLFLSVSLSPENWKRRENKEESNWFQVEFDSSVSDRIELYAGWKEVSLLLKPYGLLYGQKEHRNKELIDLFECEMGV